MPTVSSLRSGPLVGLLFCLAVAGASETEALARAEALIGQGRHAAAVALLQRLDLRAARAGYLMGFALIQLYRFEQAEDYLRRALGTDPDQPDWRHALARALLEQGRNQAALAELERAIRLADKPEYHYAKAMCALNLGRLDLAEAALRASLSLRPEQPEALYRLGRIHVDRGDYGAGIEPLSRSIALNPAQTEARFLLGLAQRHRGDLAAAAGSFVSVLERVPGHVGALFNLSAVLARLGRDDEAESWRERFQAVTALQDEIEYLKAAIRKNPQNATGRLRLAELLLEAGRAEEGLEALAAVRRMAPDDPAVYRLLERAFTIRGEDSRARQAAQVAAELEGRR